MTRAPLFFRRLILVPAFVAGCAAPPPATEGVRVPPVFSVAVTATEGETVDFLAAGAVPDPRFQADRLNPERYKKGEILLTCEGDCPRGLVLDPVAGTVSWQTGVDDAGVYRFQIKAAVGPAAERGAVIVVVKDRDRPPGWLGASPDVATVATDKMVIPLTAYDLDGDDVVVTCRDCPAGVVITGTGLEWLTTYQDVGRYDLTLRLTSRPLTRAIHAATPEDEVMAIDRRTPSETDVRARVVVSKKDRPATLTAAPGRLTVLEAETATVRVGWEDADGDPATVACAGGCPPFITVSAAGVVTARPSHDDDGDYLVTLSLAQDGRVVATTDLAVRVMNVNRPPVYGGGVMTLSGREGQGASARLAVATDPDRQDRLTYTCDAACPAWFYLAADGTATYEPGFSDAGTRTFSVRASDGRLSTLIPISLTVAETNRAPFFNPVVVSMEINALFLTRYRFFADDRDAEDRARLRFSCEGCPTGATMNTLTGEFAWTPESSQAGEHTLTVAVTDARTADPLKTTMTVALTVRLVDRAPRFAVASSLTGVEGSAVSLRDGAGQPTPLRLQAIDADGDPVSYRCAVTTGPATPSAVAGCPDGMTVNAATGEVDWTPELGRRGVYDVTFEAVSYPRWSTDPLDAKRATLAFRFIIKKLNHAPVAAPLAARAVTLYEMGHSSASYLSPQSGPTVDFVLQATDLDGDTLAYDCQNCPQGMVVDRGTGRVTWRPSYAQAQAGDTSYEGLLFFASDGDSDPFTQRPTRTFFEALSVTVLDVNRPPVLALSPAPAYDIFESGHERAEATSPTGHPLAVAAAALDPDLEPLTYTCLQGCAVDMILDHQTGRLAWTPSYDFVRGAASRAADSIILRATDGGGLFVDFPPIAVTVFDVNRPPVLNLAKLTYAGFEGGRQSTGSMRDGAWSDAPVGSPIEIAMTATDPDGDAVTFACEGACPAGLIADPRSGFATLTPGYCGPDDPSSCDNGGLGMPKNGARRANQPYGGVIFTATDGRATTRSGAVTILVKNYDRPPTLTYGSGGVTVREGEALTSLLIAQDPDGDTVSIHCDSLRGDVGGVSPIYPQAGRTACARTTAVSFETPDAVKYYWPTAGASAPPYGQVLGLLSITSPRAACVASDGVTLRPGLGQLSCLAAGLIDGSAWRDLSGATIFSVSSLGVKTSCQSQTLTTPAAGYCDAPASGAPYSLRLGATANSLMEPGAAKTLLFSKEVAIENVDRTEVAVRAGDSIATGPIDEVGGFNAQTGHETTGEILLTPEQWPYQGLNLYDVDGSFACQGASCPATAYPGTFQDGVEIYCDPSGLDGCPLGLSIQQFCDQTSSAGAVVEISGLCEYGNPDKPLASQPGCSGQVLTTDAVIGHPDARLSDLLWRRCPGKGSIKLTKVSRGSARLNNEPYRVKIGLRTGVHPDDFSRALHPPRVQTVTLNLELVNRDRPPVFTNTRGQICDQTTLGGDCVVGGGRQILKTCLPGQVDGCLPPLVAPDAVTPPLPEAQGGTEEEIILPPSAAGMLPGFVGVNPDLVSVFEPAGHYLKPFAGAGGADLWQTTAVGTRDVKTFRLAAFDRDANPEILGPHGDTEGVITYQILGCRATATPFGATSPATEPPYKNEAPRWLEAYLTRAQKSTVPYYDSGTQSWFFQCPDWVSLDAATGVVAVSPTAYDQSMTQATTEGLACYRNIKTGYQYPYTVPPTSIAANGTPVCPSVPGGTTVGKTVKDFYVVFAAAGCPRATVDGLDNSAWTARCARPSRSDTDSVRAVQIDVLDSDRKPSAVRFQVVRTERAPQTMGDPQLNPLALGVGIDRVKPALMNAGDRPFKLGACDGLSPAADLRFTEDAQDQAFWGAVVNYTDPGVDSCFRAYNVLPAGVLASGAQFMASAGTWIDVRETDAYYVILASDDPDGDPVYFDLESASKEAEQSGALSYTAVDQVTGDDGVSYQSGCDADGHCRQIMKVTPLDRDRNADRYASVRHQHPDFETPARAVALAVRACAAGSEFHPGLFGKSEATPITNGDYGNRQWSGADKVCSQVKNPGYSETAQRLFDARLDQTSPVLDGQRWDGYAILTTRFHDVDRLPILRQMSGSPIDTTRETVVLSAREYAAQDNLCLRQDNTYTVDGAATQDPLGNGLIPQLLTVFKMTDYDAADRLGRQADGSLSSRPQLVADLRQRDGAPLAAAHVESYDSLGSSQVIARDTDGRYSNRNRLRLSVSGDDIDASSTFYADNHAAPTAPVDSPYHTAATQYQVPTTIPLTSTITYDDGYGALTPAYTQTLPIDAVVEGQYVRPCIRWWATADYRTISEPSSFYHYNKIRSYILGEGPGERAITPIPDAELQSVANDRLALNALTTAAGQLLERYIGGGNDLNTDRARDVTPTALASVAASHPWLSYASNFKSAGESLPVHEVADGIILAIQGQFFEYGAASVLASDSVEVAGVSTWRPLQSVAVSSSGDFILKRLTFPPMWSFDYNTSLEGSRLTLVEELSGVLPLRGGQARRLRPSHQTLSLTPTLSMTARDPLEQDIFNARDQSAVTIDLKDDYIKPHVHLEDNTPMWSPIASCPSSRVADNSNCAARPRFDAINSIRRTGQDQTGEIVNHIAAGFRNPNLTSVIAYGGSANQEVAALDSPVSFAGTAGLGHSSDGVGSFAPFPGHTWITGATQIVLDLTPPFPLTKSVGQYLETRRVYGLVQRETGVFIVPGVLNQESQFYTDGTEVGLRRGLATGAPSSPFLYDNPSWDGNPAPFLSGYPSLRNQGDLSDYIPTDYAPYCPNGQTPISFTTEVCVSTNRDGDCSRSEFRPSFRCPSGLVYMGWTPHERSFQGGGGGCGGVLGCL